jgi:hypothetical protein
MISPKSNSSHRLNCSFEEVQSGKVELDIPQIERRTSTWKIVLMSMVFVGIGFFFAPKFYKYGNESTSGLTSPIRMEVEMEMEMVPKPLVEEEVIPIIEIPLTSTPIPIPPVPVSIPVDHNPIPIPSPRVATVLLPINGRSWQLSFELTTVKDLVQACNDLCLTNTEALGLGLEETSTKNKDITVCGVQIAEYVLDMFTTQNIQISPNPDYLYTVSVPVEGKGVFLATIDPVLGKQEAVLDSAVNFCISNRSTLGLAVTDVPACVDTVIAFLPSFYHDVQKKPIFEQFDTLKATANYTAQQDSNEEDNGSTSYYSIDAASVTHTK